MNWKSLALGGLAGVTTGLIVGVFCVTVAWGISSWQAVHAIGLPFKSAQAMAALNVGLLCGATPGAALGLLGGLVGGLIARKSGTKRAAFLWEPCSAWDLASPAGCADISLRAFWHSRVVARSIFVAKLKLVTNDT